MSAARELYRKAQAHADEQVGHNNGCLSPADEAAWVKAASDYIYERDCAWHEARDAHRVLIKENTNVR